MKSWFLKKLLKVIKENHQVFLDDWFYYWLKQQNIEKNDYFPDPVYYEFGVAGGRTLTWFAQAALRFCKDFNYDINRIKIVAFDSFQGLPDKADAGDDHPSWEKGSFSFTKDHALNRVKNTGFPVKNIQLVEGYFEDSLTPDLFEQLKNSPPSIVTLDVDYYSSTKVALDFMAPMLKSGTVMYFDDLYSFHLHPQMGQLKAINEFNGTQGWLQELREYDSRGRTYMFSRLEWEYGKD